MVVVTNQRSTPPESNVYGSLSINTGPSDHHHSLQEAASTPRDTKRKHSLQISPVTYVTSATSPTHRDAHVISNNRPSTNNTTSPRKKVCSGSPHAPKPSMKLLWKHCKKTLLQKLGTNPTKSGIEDFQLVERLGGGGQSAIWSAFPFGSRGVMKDIPEFVLVRMTNLSGEQVIKNRLLRTSVRVHEAVQRHPHIVSVFRSFEEKGVLYQVLEALFGGNLEEVHVTANETFTLHVMEQVFSALAYMHARGYSHCDVSADNIVLEGGWDQYENLPVAKLIDFGFAAEWDTRLPETRMSSRRVQKFGYTASEVHFAREFSLPEVDVHAAGVTLFFLIAGKLPFGIGFRGVVRGTEDAVKKFASLRFESEAWVGVSRGTRLLICDCVHWDPAKRPTAAMAHSRVKSLLKSLLQASSGVERWGVRTK